MLSRLIAVCFIVTLIPLVSTSHSLVSYNGHTQGDVSISDQPITITCEMIRNGTIGTFGHHLECIEGQVHIRRAFWIGRYHQKPDQIVVGFCKFCDSFYAKQPGRFIPLTNVSQQCLSYREDTLCSECSSGKSPAMNSRRYDCIQCDKKSIITYFLVNIAGLFLLCLFIFIFNFFLASGALNALIFFGQMTTTAIRVDCMGDIPMATVFKNSSADTRIDTLSVFLYGIWNLDFTSTAGSFCFTQNFENIQVLAINYFVAALPLVPVIILILLTKFLDKIQSNLSWIREKVCGDNFAACFSCKVPLITKSIDFKKWRSIKTLVASCLLLSYTKFTMTTIYLLAPVHLFDSDGKSAGKVLYYQGNLQYFGPQHAKYGVLAIFFLLSFVLGFPFLLLLLRYKPKKEMMEFKRHRGCLKTTLTHLDQFLDVCILRPFQSDLRWGKRKSRPCVGFKIWRFSFGIHDYRWYAGWYFILRFSLFAANLFAMDFVVQLLLNEILSTIALIISLVAQPYRHRVHNHLDAFVLILISVLNISVFFQYHLTYTNQSLSMGAITVQYIIDFIPAVLIVFLFFFKLVANYHRDRDEPPSEIDELSAVVQTPPSIAFQRNVTMSADYASRYAHEQQLARRPPDTPPTSRTNNRPPVKKTRFENFLNRYLCDCHREEEPPPQREGNSRGRSGRDLHVSINTPLLNASGTVARNEELD